MNCIGSQRIKRKEKDYQDGKENERLKLGR